MTGLITAWMGDEPILSVIQPITINTMLNNNWLDNGPIFWVKNLAEFPYVWTLHYTGRVWLRDQYQIHKSIVSGPRSVWTLLYSFIQAIYFSVSVSGSVSVNVILVSSLHQCLCTSGWMKQLGTSSQKALHQTWIWGICWAQVMKHARQVIHPGF